MSARGGATLRVEPLEREVLAGVVDPDAGAERGRVDLGVIPWFEDERPLQGLAGFVDWRCRGKLSALVRSGWCTGRAGEAVLMPGRPGLPVHRLVLVGLGLARDLSPAAASRGAARAVEVALRLRPRSVLFAMPGWLGERELVEAVFSGMLRALTGAPTPLRAVPAIDPGEAPSEATAAAEPTPEAIEPGAQPVDPPAGIEGSAIVGVPWWVVADARHVARLRRLLEGPPRPAEP